MSFTKKHISITAVTCLLAIDGTTANVYKSATPSVRNLQGSKPHRSLMFRMEPHVAPPVPESVASVHAAGAEASGAVGAVHPVTGVGATGAAGHTAVAGEEANEAGALHHGTTPPKHEGPYAVFVQQWIPTLKLQGKKGDWITYVPAVMEDDFNKHLMIDDYHLVHPKAANGPEKIPSPVLRKINQRTWIDPANNEQVYQDTWRKYGRQSGLNVGDYVNLLNELQTRHPTPEALHVKDKSQAISHSVLEKDFKNACLSCTKHEGKQYLSSVHHCLEVNEKTHHPKQGTVPYAKHCGVCPNACADKPIHIPQVLVA